MLLETWLGGGSEMHQQEESGEIPDAAGQRDQNTEGETCCLFLGRYRNIKYVWLFEISFKLTSEYVTLIFKGLYKM